MLHQDSNSEPRRPEENPTEASPATSRWVKSKELNKVLIEAAERKQWLLVDSYLTQISNNQATRGAPLLRAINLPTYPDGMPLLAVLLSKRAPSELIERSIELGASTAFRCTVREPSGLSVSGCTMMHLAVLVGRLDIVGRAQPRGLKIPLENNRGECPIRQLARIATLESLQSEHMLKVIGIAARRYILSGGAGIEIARAVSLLCMKKAWAAAETVLDCLAGAEGLKEEEKLKGSDLCKWAWFGVHQDAPITFFNSLRGVVNASQYNGALASATPMDKEFLQRLVPRDALVPNTTNHDWSAFESRLERLAACRGVIDLQTLAECVNVRNDKITVQPLDEFLEELGWIDVAVQLKPLSLLHLMVYAGASARAVDLMFELGVDPTYQTWVGRGDKTIFDGTPLHMAIARQELGQMERLIANKMPVSQINAAGETELHYLFSTFEGNLPLDKLPMAELLIRAGCRIDGHRNVAGRSLESMSIQGYRVADLIKAVKEFDPEGVKSGKSIAEDIPAKYQVISDRGKLIEVDEQGLRATLLAEYRAHFHHHGKDFDDIEDIKALDKYVSMQIPEVRAIVERLHYAFHNPFIRERSVSSADTSPSETDESSAAEEYFEEFSEPEDEFGQSKDSEGEFLSFPDFSGAEFGFTYEDPSLENSDADPSGEFELIGDDEDPSYEPPSEAAVTSNTESKTHEEEKFDEKPNRPKAFEKSLLDTLEMTEDDIVGFLNEEATEVTPEIGSIPPGLLSTPMGALLSSFIDMEYDFHHPKAVRTAVIRSIREGQHYEAYLLLKCLDELRTSKPSELSAISRSLRSLLYRFPPEVANSLGTMVDGFYSSNADGAHPYMAELACLLRNPLDTRKDPSSIGGLTLGITSVSKLYRFGVAHGDIVNAWGEIGTWNFAFPVFRFDAQPVSPGTKSLMEMSGMAKVREPVDEWWINPKTKKEEHLLGALFYIAKDTPFHRNFDHQTATKLGFAPLGRETIVVFRRACIIVSHPSHGTLVIRNSSHTFGRDRLNHFGMWHPAPRSLEQVLNLSREEISKTFVSVVSNSFFKQQKIAEELNHELFVRPHHHGMRRAAQPLNFLMGQARTVRAAHARNKFDSNTSTAWQDGQLVGGYKSPLFGSVVEQLNHAFHSARSSRGGNVIVPMLAFANPDYFLAPHARLSTSEETIEILKKLADGREHEITERALQRSGVRDFLDTGFKRGRNSELVLLPPDA